MKSKLFIPEKLKVGYQERSDTYTKKLAYVIYYDSKGVLRKEKSWESWRQKRQENVWLGYEKNEDGTPNYSKHIQGTREELPIDDFTNEPLEGFILNRDGGGGRGWDSRKSFVRVWDPRGFEFEISIPNLLFILQESTSTKGKGLEGKFVYSWEGTELVLLPVDSQEYRDSTGFTAIQSNKIGTADLEEGFIYTSKQQDNYMYMGKILWTTRRLIRENTKQGYKYVTKYSTKKSHIFYDIKSNTFCPIDSLTKFAIKLSYDSTFPEKFEKLQTLGACNIISHLEHVEAKMKIPNESGASKWLENPLIKLNKDGSYSKYLIYEDYKYQYEVGKPKHVFQGYSLNLSSVIKFEDQKIYEEQDYKYNPNWREKKYTKQEVENMNCVNLNVVFKNGKKINYKNYKI